MTTILNVLYGLNALVFVFLMIMISCMVRQEKMVPSILQQREGFCTCRGAQYNNSSADVNQANCYANKIPSKVWNQSYAGCTSFADPGKIAYDYNVLEKQLPEFAGV